MPWMVIVIHEAEDYPDWELFEEEFYLHEENAQAAADALNAEALGRWNRDHRNIHEVQRQAARKNRVLFEAGLQSWNPTDAELGDYVSVTEIPANLAATRYKIQQILFCDEGGF